MAASARNKVLLRGEESGGAVAIVENTMPAGAPGPPLHSHAFDEAFYVLDAELTVQVDDQVTTAHSGELPLAERARILLGVKARHGLSLTEPGIGGKQERRPASPSQTCC